MDILITCLMVSSLASGLYTLHANRRFFVEFKLVDFVNGRFDSWLYFVNSLTTAFCFVDLLHFVFQETIHWPSVVHCVTLLLIVTLHFSTNTLLRKSEFCRLCKRKFNDSKHEP